MTLKEKVVLLKKLKDERDLINQKPRFGVKPRWTENGDSFFRNLKISLQSNSKNRIEDLKRSMSI